jgi:hypothetical protein
MVTRPSGELAIAQGAQLATQGLSGDADLEFLPQPLAQIDHPPAHDPMDGGDRPALDGRRQRRTMHLVQSRHWPWRLAVNQTVRPFRIEPQYPVPHDLQTNIADARGIAAARAVVDRSQRQQPTRLLGVLRTSRQATHLRSTEVQSKRYRCGHGGHPAVRHGESHQHRVGEAL